MGLFEMAHKSLREHSTLIAAWRQDWEYLYKLSLTEEDAHAFYETVGKMARHNAREIPGGNRVQRR
jgi:hypothetical protein